MRYNKEQRRMEYEVGDKVRIANENTLLGIQARGGDRYRITVCGDMLQYANRDSVIASVHEEPDRVYYTLENGGGWSWTDTMFSDITDRIEHQQRAELWQVYQNMIEDGFCPSATLQYAMLRFLNEGFFAEVVEVVDDLDLTERTILRLICVCNGDVSVAKRKFRYSNFGDKHWDTYFMKFTHYEENSRKDKV